MAPPGVVDDIASGIGVILTPTGAQSSIPEHAISRKIRHAEIEFNIIVKITVRDHAEHHLHARHVPRHVLIARRINLNGFDKFKPRRRHADRRPRLCKEHIIQRAADRARLVDGDPDLFRRAHGVFEIVFIKADRVARVRALAGVPGICHKVCLSAVARRIIGAEHGAVHGKDLAERFIHRTDDVRVGGCIPLIDLVG